MTDSRRLGRGLEALLGPISREQAQREDALRELPVADISPNPLQPRRSFDEAALQELADSIKASELLQPVVVRPRDGRYELIAGERRWRAVQRLGWQRVPAVIKEVDDTTLLTLALIENLQRDDLSPIDEALGYQRLLVEFALPQAEVARLVGKSRVTVTNILRLLKLPAEVQAMLHEGRLSEGHARALLGLEDAARIRKLAETAATDGWSVREVEQKVRHLSGRGRARPPARPAAAPVAADAKRVEDALRRRLGTDVHVITRRGGKGKISIAYYNNDDLSRILELILGRPFDG